MATTDTTPDARRRVMAVFSAMSGAERVRYATEMADEVREVAMAGIRTRHPDYDDQQVRTAWFAMLHGDAIADEITRCSSSS